MEAYLSDAFVRRVQRAYRRAIAAIPRTRGQWASHNERRADVHAALLADNTAALCAIFADPTSTELYYGTDTLCRGYVTLRDPTEFVHEALRNDRARCAAYQIKRLQELNPDAASVIEIGPGMGRAAYYGYLAGLDYTTIDLPLGMVAQGCFLGRALGPDALWFAGEDDVPRDGRIKLLCRAPDWRFDVALNVDSITEMPTAVAFDYFDWASGHCRCLLSINHEKNRFTVTHLAAFAGPNEVIAKRPCPAWSGYTEEAFLLNGPGIVPRPLRLTAFQTFVLAGRIKRTVARRF